MLGLVCVGDANPTSFTLKESTRLDIKKWWETIEDALGKPLLSNDHRKQANNCYVRVVLELKIHLVEKSVQDIMDVSRSELQANKRIFGGVADEEDEDDDRTGAGPAAEYGKPIFAPTVRLAAPVFRKITLFSDAVKRLFYDEGIYLPQFSSASASAASMDVGIGGGIQRQSSAVPRAVSQLQGANHPNKQSNLMKGSASGGGQASGASGTMLTYTSKLLELVQATLENELLPVVQSAVNSEMQNIQNRPDLFAIQNTMDVLNLMTGATDLFVNLCCVLFDTCYLCVQQKISPGRCHYCLRQHCLQPKWHHRCFIIGCSCRSTAIWWSRFLIGALVRYISV
jgi:hypothetical protein